MEREIEDWLRRCPACGMWASLLPPRGLPTGSGTTLLEERREAGLRGLRTATFEVVLNAMERGGGLAGARILEVGCAYGWFLQGAARRGARATGIEPERPVAERALAEGLDVRVGCFPDCVDPGERFDAIVFNDVLEHLPDLNRILAACRDLLAPRGKLVINLPDSDGLIYHGACLAARLGYRPSLHRLWQRNFPFPHLYYFNAANLELLVARSGFRMIHSQGLPMIRLRGLWTRLRMDRLATPAGAAVVYAFLLAAYPFLWFAAADALLQIHERTDQSGRSS